MEEYKNFRPDDPTRKTKALLQYVPLPQPGTPPGGSRASSQPQAPTHLSVQQTLHQSLLCAGPCPQHQGCSTVWGRHPMCSERGGERDETR